MFLHIELSVQLVASLGAHTLSDTQERAVRASLQREIAALLGALPPNTHTVCAGYPDTKTSTSGGLQTLADVLFETVANDDTGVLVTLRDMEEALVAAAASSGTHGCIDMSRTTPVWQSTPKRCFQWSVRFRFNQLVFDAMEQSSAPAAAVAEPETPPPELNQFARVTAGQNDDGGTAAAAELVAAAAAAVDTTRSLRRKRDQLAQTLVKRAIEADDDAIEALVQVSREKSRGRSGTTAAAAAAATAKQNDVKAFPKITVASSTTPRGGVTKRKGPMKKAKIERSSNAKKSGGGDDDDDDDSTGGSGVGLVSGLLSKLFESGAVSKDPYVAQYATKPGLFHRVQRK
jgi:hypothetical protein